MSSVLAYRSPDAVICPDVVNEDCGDSVDGTLKRLDRVEADISVLKTDVSELKFNVREILATIANLVTKKELSDLRGELRSEIADVRGEIKDVRTEIASMEAKLIRWTVATGLTTTGLAFAAAKFIH